MVDHSSPMRSVAHAVPSERRERHRNPGHSRSKGIAAFTASLAHDLRTPLTVIQEYAALMREGLIGDLNVEQQCVLDVIADRACDLNRVVDNAVDASKLATKSYRVWARPCALRGILARIRPQLLRKAAIRRVDLEFEMSCEAPNIHCDDEVVGRAIANIVTAALNLCPDGCRMSIAEEVDPDLKEVGIRVSVDGANVDTITAFFRDLAKVEKPERDRASQICETSLAVTLIDRSLGTLTLALVDGGASALRIGLPIVDPVEILRRHLLRATRRHSRAERVSLIKATVFDTVDKELSRDVYNILISSLGRNDLGIELDSNHWLLAVVDWQVRTEALQRRIERRRAAVNRKRLGRPLPQVSLRRIGTWKLPNELARILTTVGGRFEQCAPANVCAE
ncbi:MAG TPA: histidine kinase dimerization/phospho-acceptor domain-containing protein [Planctomycetaceae bacterium]|jgi:hypothetical protein|nr:histidine kinase dimerization/phospho-acceptor domain-containing protein [Planctomycetaceae bacterium]